MPVILITGANRGIGLCILERLLNAFPSNKYILASRDATNGRSTISDLEQRSIIHAHHSVDLLELDVSSPRSIIQAAEVLKESYGLVDVVINNAGVATTHSATDDLNKIENIWHQTLLVNVVGPHLLFQALTDLLVKSNAPRIINISSGRASLSRSANGDLPPTSVISYSVSKVALNGLGVEMAKILSIATQGQGRVWNVNPGHCKTAFNGYKGKRDPMDGAAIVELLLMRDSEGKTVDSGFWEEDAGELRLIPW